MATSGPFLAAFDQVLPAAVAFAEANTQPFDNTHTIRLFNTHATSSLYVFFGLLAGATTATSLRIGPGVTDYIPIGTNLFRGEIRPAGSRSLCFAGDTNFTVNVSYLNSIGPDIFPGG